MPKDANDLEVRFLPKDELGKIPRRKRTTKKSLVVAWLAHRLTVPVMGDDEKPLLDEKGDPARRDLDIGEGIEIGPFGSATEGVNWMRYYLPDAYKLRGWGKQKAANGKAISPVAIDPVERDGKVYMVIERVLE